LLSNAHRSFPECLCIVSVKYVPVNCRSNVLIRFKECDLPRRTLTVVLCRG
jgi:hypothetical protein